MLSENSQSKNFYRGVLGNIDSIFKRLDSEDINYFFSLLCDANNLAKVEKMSLCTVFSTLNDTLYYMKEEEEIIYSIESFKSHLNFISLIKFYKTRFDFPSEIRTRLQMCLHSLDGYIEIAPNQSDEVVEQFNFIATRINNILNNIQINQLIEKPEVKRLLNKLENIKNDNNEAFELINCLNHINDGNILSVKREKELYKNFNIVINSSLYEKNNFIVFIYEGLQTANSELLCQGIDLYISYLGYNPDNLTIQNKLELFYTDRWFEHQNYYTNSLIELILLDYTPNVFLNIMERYKLPFNMPIVSFEDGDIKLTPLVKYAAQNNLNILDDLLDKNIWSSFKGQINCSNEIKKIEINSKNVEYSQQEYCVFINSRLINENFMITNKNIFFEFLNTGYYLAFSKLYHQVKFYNPEFNLKNILLDDLDLMEYFFQIDDELVIPKDLFNIFREENFSIEKSKEKLSNKDVNYTLNVLKELSPLIPEIYKKPVELFKEIPKESNQKNCNWYNPSDIIITLKEGACAKDAILKKLYSSQKYTKPILQVKDESFFNELELKLPNFKEIIDYYKGQFRQGFYGNKKRINPILLLGEPGIGKTYFSQELAKCLQTGYDFIDMGSLTASWVLTGNNGTWQDSKQGKIFDVMLKSPTFNPIVLLDELDKSSGTNSNPTVCLHQLLEEINAQKFTDEFLDLTFDASGIIYIACANTIQTLSDPLLSRFKVFTVPSPTSEQLNPIIHNMYNNSIKNNPLLESDLSQELIDNLKNNSLREIKILLEEGINNALLDYSRDELNNMAEKGEKISLSSRYFRQKETKVKLGF